MPTEFGASVTAPMQDVSQTGRTVGASKSDSFSPLTKDGRIAFGGSLKDGSSSVVKLHRSKLKSGPSVKQRLASESFIRTRLASIKEATDVKRVSITTPSAPSKSPIKRVDIEKLHAIPHGIPNLQATVGTERKINTGESPKENRQFLRSAKSVHRSMNPNAEPHGLTKGGRDWRADKINRWMRMHGLDHTESFSSRQKLRSL